MRRGIECRANATDCDDPAPGGRGGLLYEESRVAGSAPVVADVPNPLGPARIYRCPRSATMTASVRRSTVVHDSASSPRVRTDAELVEACLAGDAAAERALYQQHADTLHRVAFRLCGDPDVAADITQEAFVQAFARLSQFRAESTLRTWLIAILVSAAGKTLRKGRWLRDRSTDLNERIPQPPGSSHDADLAAHVNAAIAALSDKLRVVVVMHDVEGFTHLEIAIALRIPTGTSKGRLADARTKLRAALAKHWKDRML